VSGFATAAARPETLLVLLLAGHFLADFLFQTRTAVEAKRRGIGYAGHGLVVLGAHLLALLPLLSLPVAGVAAGIALAHVGADRVKTAATRERPARLSAFLLDQAVHVAVVVVGWLILVGAGALPALRWLSPAQLGEWTAVVGLAAAFAFNATGGSAVVEGVLDLLPPERANPSGYPGAGRLIGMLERTLMLFLVLYGQWAAAVLLLTAKSIARFEELKERRFAEYYLVGTLTSLLVATVIGLVLGRLLGGV
jgi:hypothetical protein